MKDGVACADPEARMCSATNSEESGRSQRQPLRLHWSAPSSSTAAVTPMVVFCIPNNDSSNNEGRNNHQILLLLLLAVTPHLKLLHSVFFDM